MFMFDYVYGPYARALMTGYVLPHVAIDLCDWTDVLRANFGGYYFGGDQYAEHDTDGNSMVYGRDGLDSMLVHLADSIKRVQYHRRHGRISVPEVLELMRMYYQQRKYGGGACFFVPFKDNYETWSSLQPHVTLVTGAWAGKLWCYHVIRFNLGSTLGSRIVTALRNYVSEKVSPFKSIELPPPAGLYHHALSRICAYFLLYRAFRLTGVLPAKSFGSRLFRYCLPPRMVGVTRKIVRGGYFVWPTMIGDYLFWLVRKVASWSVDIFHPAINYVHDIGTTDFYSTYTQILMHPFHKPPICYDQLWKAHYDQVLPFVVRQLGLNLDRVIDFQVHYLKDPKAMMSMIDLQSL